MVPLPEIRIDTDAECEDLEAIALQLRAAAIEVGGSATVALIDQGQQAWKEVLRERGLLSKRAVQALLVGATFFSAIALVQFGDVDAAPVIDAMQTQVVYLAGLLGEDGAIPR